MRQLQLFCTSLDSYTVNQRVTFELPSGDLISNAPLQQP